MNDFVPQDQGEDDEVLVGLLRQRDVPAFYRMVKQHSARVIQKARLLLESQQAAEDAAQEVFLKAFRAMHSVRGPRVWPWLAGITFNHCMDILRERGKNPSTVRFSERLAKAPAVQPAGEMPEILRGLNPTERTVVFLRIVEEMSYEEIAQVTGLAPGSLRNLLSKCLRSLREEIQNSGV